jgi:predicted nucleic acid-binding protein
VILVDANLLIYSWNGSAPEHRVARDWNVFVPEPTARHTEILAALLERVDRPSLVPDAHLAALAIEYGLVLHSSDADFARFPEVAWENPLSS